MSLLQGAVERITFHNTENGYTVARVATNRGLVTVVGTMAGLHVGASVEMQGDWGLHPKFGQQFKVTSYRMVLPATIKGIERYLGSGLIKGIGPVTARRIVQHFGNQALDIIDREPHRLADVPGVGKKRVKMIQEAWVEQRQIKEVMVFLQGHGVSTGLAVKIYKHYGDSALSVLQKDPYLLQQDIHGIGFLTADKIARALGLPHDSPERVAAGVAYILEQDTYDGHVFTPLESLIDRAAQLLAVATDLVAEIIVQMQARKHVQVDAVAGLAAVYLAPMYYAEVGIANRLQQLLQAPSALQPLFGRFDWIQAFRHLRQQLGVTLADAQMRGLKEALTQKVTVLTGGPGTGKTTTLRAIIQLLRAAKVPFVLAAPTGRAAKRMSEVTGVEAKTIHRLLEVSPDQGFRFQRNAENPLAAHMVIVDEASMLDVLLTNHLLKAIAPEAHLLLVGDVDQLPSVGAGNVLRDIIASGAAAVVPLQVIFRQAAHSNIITNAHRINQGKMPVFPKDAQDFFLFPREDKEAAADMVVDLVARRIPARFTIPSAEIQVLTPMHRGPLGVAALNQRLQALLNPPAAQKPERTQGGRVFRPGDRVMQTRNNYTLAVFNGDMGIITAIDLVMQSLTVVFDGRAVRYDWASLDELTHAWAISVHKSQGSEFRAVVMPVHTTHYIMLQRNLIYTGVTRARQMVVLVGTRKAIAIAVRNNKVSERHTGLAQRLVQPQMAIEAAD